MAGLGDTLESLFSQYTRQYELSFFSNNCQYFDLLWDAPVPLGCRALYTSYSQLWILGASSPAEGQKS